MRYITASGLGRPTPIGQTAGMSEPLLAWAVLIFGYLLPLLHVALSPRFIIRSKPIVARLIDTGGPLAKFKKRFQGLGLEK